jgi:NADPH:quinone reductase-like Zn-dependent oxidoreductase
VKAIVRDAYGSPDVLSLRDVERPAVGDDGVLVRVHAASSNPLDWHVLRGIPYVMRAQSGLRHPKRRILGNDVAGVVEEVGSGVTRFRPGDEVYGEAGGSFAEYARGTQDSLEIKPANLTFPQAAAVPVAGLTALQGLRDKGRVRPGQRVLIVGASGGVGTFAVQIARSLGATVTGVCSTANVDLVRSLGADDVIDYSREDFTTRGERYDVILQLGGTTSPVACRRALTPSGTLVLSSGDSGGRVIGPLGRMLEALALNPFVQQRLVSFIADVTAEDLRALRALIEDGAVTPVIARTCSLEEVPDAIRLVETGHTRGKVIIAVQGDRGDTVTAPADPGAG